jgi:sulfite reductase (NADPH) hemoprotein beta-component
MAGLASVARITYLVSDVLVNSQPTLPSKSPFADTFNALSEASSHRPTVIPVPLGADPGSTILQSHATGLTSYTASSHPEVLTRLVVHLAELSSLPVVLHLAVKDDLSDVLLLRSAVPFFLVSSTAQQAHDNALLASLLARNEKKAGVHVFYENTGEVAVEEIAEEKIRPFLLAEKPTLVNGHGLNGHGHVNGNGHLNGINGHTCPPSPTDVTLQQLFKAYSTADLSTLALVRRSLRPLNHHGSSDPQTVIFALGRVPEISFGADLVGISFVAVSLLNPLTTSTILKYIPPSTTRVIVLEQVQRWSMKWTPLYLDIVGALQQRPSDNRPIVYSGYLHPSNSLTLIDVLKLVGRASSASPSTRLTLGDASYSPERPITDTPHVPRHESSYTKILTHLFSSRLDISNSPSLIPTQGSHVTSPEFALGRVRGQLDQRADLVKSVQALLVEPSLDKQLHSLLSQWLLAKDDSVKSRTLGSQITDKLASTPLTYPSIPHILSLRSHFPSLSRWIIGSDAWAYDLGSSGLHHAIASKLNINILILDTLPYSSRHTADPNRRKQDVGLYAMNHGDVYVASVAVYSSYSQVLQSLMEADRFEGPSVVLAYLPYATEESPALDVLKETKLAVDAGYWPLYRWDPSKERVGKEPFVLDSDAVKNDLQQFLDRQNHLSQLVRSKPRLATELVSSLGENVKEARKKRAQQSYNELLTALDAPPLLVLYASDGGAAEKVAKRLANRAKARGLTTTVATMDSMPLDTLAEEEHAVFITSVAGQGEPPQNGRTFFKTLNAAVSREEKLLPKLRFSVFGMGDSHYWPRPEDAHYYNKPSKDLDARLEKLGGERIADLGLGDDQDADGPETGYKNWEPLVWKALGVDSIEAREAEPEPITNEHIKAASGYLRGTIAEGLDDTSTGALAPSDGQLTKFHGIYQQDDRDIRDERQAEGAESAYSFMIRVRMPGGVCQPDQWLQMDQIADEHGSGTFKITTRQTFQFHGVIKRHLKPSIQAINRALLDTLAACGDVNR